MLYSWANVNCHGASNSQEIKPFTLGNWILTFVVQSTPLQADLELCLSIEGHL